MDQDSALDQQESEASLDAQADSLVSGQEAQGSRTDEAAPDASDRINGMMRLLGHRTTERDSQKARADAAEAALEDAQQRLYLYEGGARMSDDQADEVAADVEVEDSGEAQQAEADDDFNYWLPGGMHAPNGGDPASYVDPSAASRASSIMATNPNSTAAVRDRFHHELDQALTNWGVEGRD